MKTILFYLSLLFIFVAGFLNSETLTGYYPSIDPYRFGFLPLGDDHVMYWEESGNPHGQPILFLHGGPGLGTVSDNRRFFDPAHYRIILFDQRGCGKSLPSASLEKNTTWDLVNDIEKLRAHLGIDSWFLFGGSWGSTLSLTYAIKHPNRIAGLILRGIFLCRPKEIHWFYQNGAHFIFPDSWEDYCHPIPLEERNDLVKAFYERLTKGTIDERIAATKAWTIWEGKTSKLKQDNFTLNRLTSKQAYALARIENHYFMHNTFFENENWILENINAIRHLPCIIVQGRYDIVCPMLSAWDLHRAWPEASFHIISDAGHSSTEPGILDALIKATNHFRNLSKIE